MTDDEGEASSFYKAGELEDTKPGLRIEPVGAPWSHRDAVVRPEPSATIDNAESEHSNLHIDVSLDHLLDEQTLDEGDQIKELMKGVPIKK